MKKLINFTIIFFLSYLCLGVVPKPFGFYKNASASPNSHTLTTSLIAYWKMEEADGTSRLDSTSNGHNLSNHGVVTKDTTHIGGSFAAGTGASAYLDSSDSVFNTTSDWSCSIWVYHNALPGDDRVLISRWTPDLSWVAAYEGDTIELLVADSSGVIGSQHVTSTITFSTGAWYLVCFGIDTANHQLWIQINNETRVVASYTSLHNTSDKFTIADYSGGDGSASIIKVDETAFWSKVLSTSEVSQIWNGGNGLFYDSW